MLVAGPTWNCAKHDMVLHKQVVQKVDGILEWCLALIFSVHEFHTSARSNSFQCVALLLSVT